ncbi:hypothetical protein JTE90_000669 [Oedothorax gibbosus]|uniref:non-specific serine/threonine protein kinase n=1 Tax=Oedothorax gibbosus TaxID=931172 RepID=A0AAV6VWX8_9ARAC|nr:hypothetical protein JTE90_000669 [Oedothorax gibbosus]
MNRKEGNQSYYQSTFDIYVGNVNKSIEEADLKQIFAKYGEVKQVLCRRKDDIIGYAIVKFVYKLDAERVLRTDEVVCKGHHLPVKAARRSEQSNQANGPNDNKPHPYPEPIANVAPSGPHYSNTDFGYFHPPHPPVLNEDHHMHSQPTMLEVLCTNVEDAITFYGYSCSRAEELAFVGNSLNQMNLQQGRFNQVPVPKKVYAALFSEDNAWYRCTVIQRTIPNKPGVCLVRYIDYGNQEEVHYRNITDIPETLQKILPFTSKFIFANLVCDVKNKKTYLHQLVNKRMSLCAMLLNSNRECCEYQVLKCSCNGKDVVSETISKGFAKLKRSVPSKPNPQQDYIPKPKAYASGSEIRLNNSNPPVHILKAKEYSNNIPHSNKVPHKVPPKNNNNKPIPPKKDNVHCNGIAQKDAKNEQDFHPMRIVKRGSELSDVLKCNGSMNPSKGNGLVNAPKSNNGSVNVPKEASKLPSPLLMIDTVIPNLKLINNIRSLVSQSSDDSIINCAVDLLKEEISTIALTESTKKCVGDAYNEYSEALDKIKKCTDKSLLSSLKLERDLCRSTLCEKLKTYLGSCDNSIFERKEKIQKTIIDLESNSNAWMNVQLDKKPNNLEELITEYNKVKEERWKLVSETRQNTNQKHKIFMNLFADLQKELFLNTLEETDNSNSHVDNSSTRKSPLYSQKITESLTDLSKALDKEIQMLTLNKERKAISIIQCLLDILDSHKEKVDAVCDLYENRYAMLNELSKLPDIETTLSDLATTEEEVHNLTLRFADYRNSVVANENCTLSPEISELVKELHRTILKEDYLKTILAKASDSYFPELNVEHPELRLFDHTRNKSLVKNWKLEYFFNTQLNARRNLSFSSQLIEEPVVIKEYTFSSLEESNMFMKKSVSWNETKSDSLVKIKALFPGISTNVYVILPPVTTTLLDRCLVPSPFEAEKACRILRNVLTGLKDIHRQGLVHRCLHPLTVLVENEKGLLDFCYDSKYLDGLTTLKGINFQPPELKASHESADMYSFGCLVLWVLFPNLSFSATTDGVPNVAAFRSIIEELILPKDYALLSALVDAKPERRPSSSILLNHGFLSKYEAYCRSQCEAQKV